MNYDFSRIEKKWQHFWDEHKTFKCERDESKPKFYVLDMFPYPSGAGLHVGHCEGQTATDIVARYKRMRGFNVLHPMGWDSFGLPTENYAIKMGIHPEEITKRNIKTFKRQLKALGCSYDWDRELATSHKDYYKWTQWIFLQLYNRGLAYEAETAVNWCPELKTVLANEEVVDGKSEVGGHPVIRRPMKQWMLKITDYADRLLEDLDELDWPSGIKELQRHWIGKSFGAEIIFPVEGSEHTLNVYTTRPDTLFGATYMAIAPEHPLVSSLSTDNQKSLVENYCQDALRKSELDRAELAKDKTGIFSGSYAINPGNAQRIPIWIADYVLSSYGTGAVMAVAAHDQRDWEFAVKFALPIVSVIKGGPPIEKGPYLGDGPHWNSPPIDKLNNAKAKEVIISWLEKRGAGKAKVNYKLRDWAFSRQRYWGEPFPILKDCDTGEVLRCLGPDELPLTLPDVDKYEPSGTGESPLATLTEWHTFFDPVCKKRVRRETHTMPQWAGSCWYYLRFINPRNQEKPWNPSLEKHWMPVDLYVGGVEHAVLHLLYARFWHKVLYDLELVSTREPFKKLVNQGMILGENGEKMSKSRGNVVNPDDVIKDYGADALRLYEMFMGPLEKVKPWQMGGIKGVFNFLQKSFKLLMGNKTFAPEDENTELTKALHRCIKKVTEDIEAMRFNTAISAMMIFINKAQKEKCLSKETAKSFTKLLSPFAPHMAEEIWEHLGHKISITFAPWPTFDETLAKEELITMAVQINGKTRATLDVPIDISKDDFLTLAKKEELISKWLLGKTIVKEIFVPQKIANIVLKKDAKTH